ncbi:DUF2584 domain-containing protein [Bacillus sp. WMMC1349]|uniref:DUF2584 domain-containing protein n=1 Tax=Bacillus sp. WMMC1349 TaxID=2736254 RepID=UPI0015580151|nr:DUF2584 domain-containing protein [Bacillus sp. WMMC1349]NPC93823.1 DUF2584 domain-containing protein [Bacillus sp. WMMC1349]
MGMPVEFNTMIVTKGKETRIEENVFILKKEGYRVYPLHVPIEVRKTKEGDMTGTAYAERLEWSDGYTFLTYRLVSLNSTN